jgi:hypothetical protein
METRTIVILTWFIMFIMFMLYFRNINKVIENGDGKEDFNGVLKDDIIHAEILDGETGKPTGKTLTIPLVNMPRSNVTIVKLNYGLYTNSYNVKDHQKYIDSLITYLKNEENGGPEVSVPVPNIYYKDTSPTSPLCTSIGKSGTLLDYKKIKFI